MEDNDVEKFKIRSGTIDHGTPYEIQMAALISLRCVLRNSEDFWVACNVDGVGCFDDIIAHQGKTTYMFQVKHKDQSININENDFLYETRKKVCLKTYIRDINKIKTNIDNKSKGITQKLGNFNDIYFALFTNMGVNDYKFIRKESNDTLAPFNTSCSRSYLYSFDYSKLPEDYELRNTENCSNYYVFTNQVHFEDLQKEIKTTINHILNINDSHDISENFTKFVTNWLSDNHYYLTKQDVLSILGYLFFCQFEVNFRHDAYYECKQKAIWNDIIQDKSITIVPYNESNLKFLLQYISTEVRMHHNALNNINWADNLNQEIKNAFYQNHKVLKRDVLKIVGRRGEITPFDIYKCLCIANKMPFLLQIHNSDNYKEILRVCNKTNCKVILLNKIEQPLSLEINMAKHFESLEDLYNEERAKILQQPIKFQGRTNAILKNFVNKNMYNYIKCEDVIKILSADFNIGNNIKCLPEYHIERFLTKVFVRTGILDALNEELFLIEQQPGRKFNMLNVKSTNIRKLEEVNIHRLERYHIIISSGDICWVQLQNLILPNKNVHHLSICDKNKLEWKMSYGPTDCMGQIRNFLIESHTEPIMDIINNPSKRTTLINATPGMGKTILMDYIAYQAPLNRWVLRINLNLKEHYSFCKTPTYETSNIKALEYLNYFKRALSDKTDSNSALTDAIFKKMIKNKEVIVLLDGIDEIPSDDYKERVLNIAKCLHQEGFHLCITMRPFMKLELEKEFESFSITLGPFNNKDQKLFLTKYFQAKHFSLAQNSQNTRTTTEMFVDKLLEALADKLDDKDAEFASVPLQSQLLAEAFSDEYENYLLNEGTVNFNVNFDLLYLYQNFIERKAEILLDKNAAVGERSLLKIQTYLALKHVLPLDEDAFALISTNMQVDKEPTSKPEVIDMLRKEGVIATIDEHNNISFTHRTFCEFLTGKWLYENYNNPNVKLNNVALIIISQRFLQQYKFVFDIFDRFVAKKCQVHLAIINGNINEAKRIINLNPSSITKIDKYGRSLLHMAAIYAAQFPPLFDNKCNILMDAKKFLSTRSFALDGILEIVRILPDEIFLGIKPDMLGYSPLDYALANYSLTIAEHLCLKSRKSLNINVNIALNLKASLLGYCIKLNYDNLFNLLFRYYLSRDLLLKNIDSEEKVHTYFINMFKKGKDKTILKYPETKSLPNTSILKFLEIKSNNRFTDLRYAAVFGSTKHLNEFIEKGEDVNIQDVDKNTPLHYAVLHQKLENIKLLLSKGVKANIPNIDGNTPLHLVFMTKTGEKGLPNTSTKKNILGDNIPETISELLLSKDADLNKQNKDGDTPFHLAVLAENTELVRFLLKKNAITNIQNKKEQSILHYAAQVGNDDILNAILLTSIEIDQQDIDGNTPLHLALSANKLNVIPLLKSHGATWNIQNKYGISVYRCLIKEGNANIAAENISRNSIDTNDSDGNTPLHIALKYRQIRTAEKYILSDNADVNIPNKLGNTSLHIAAKKGLSSITSAILLKTAEVDKQNNEGNTPLHLATKYKHRDILKLLIDYKASINIQNRFGETALHCAVINDCFEICEELLCEGSDIDKQNNEYNTALHLALVYDKKEIAKLLVSQNANVNVKNRTGNNALHLAAVKGYYKLVHKILHLISDINTANNDGNTAFHLAAVEGQNNIVELLIEQVDIRLQNRVGKTALHLACKHGHEEVVKSLLSKNLDVNIQTFHHNTPLHFALINNHERIVELLINKGANVHVRNNKGETGLYYLIKDDFHTILERVLSKYIINAVYNDVGDTILHLASMYSRKDVVRLLISLGANVNVKNNLEEIPLHYAVEYGYDFQLRGLRKDLMVVKHKTPLQILADNHRTTIQLLVSNGADINLPSRNGKTGLHYLIIKGFDNIIPKDNIGNKQDNDGNSPLHLALTYHHLIIFKRLVVSSNINLNLQNKKGKTILHIAAEEGFEGIISELISKGLKVDEKDNDGNTPLYSALLANQREAALELLDNNAKIDFKNKNQDTALHLAITKGYDSIVKKILHKHYRNSDENSEHGSDTNYYEKLVINQPNKEKNTPLHLAITYGKAESALQLIANNADVNFKNRLGETPLHLAAQHGYNNIVFELIQMCDINVQKNGGNTPLHMALKNNNYRTIGLLIENNANVNLANSKNETCLHYLIKEGYKKEVLKKIQNRSFNDIKDNEGNTPLHLAVRQGWQDVVKLLIHNGANLELQDGKGKTALHLAAEEGCIDIVNELLCNNLDVNRMDNHKNTALHTALINNHLHIVGPLIKKNADVNIKNRKGVSAKQLAKDRGCLL